LLINNIRQDSIARLGETPGVLRCFDNFLRAEHAQASALPSARKNHWGIGMGKGRQSKMANLRAEKIGQPNYLSKHYKNQNLVRENLWDMAKVAIHSDDPKGSENGEPSGAAACYIGAMASELSKIAKSNGLDTLVTILEMARLEAEQT
jgi:hypothetical protein